MNKNSNINLFFSSRHQFSRNIQKTFIIWIPSTTTLITKKAIISEKKRTFLTGGLKLIYSLVISPHANVFGHVNQLSFDRSLIIAVNMKQTISFLMNCNFIVISYHILSTINTISIVILSLYPTIRVNKGNIFCISSNPIKKNRIKKNEGNIYTVLF